MPETCVITAESQTLSRAGSWSVSRAEDAAGHPVRVSTLRLPDRLSSAGRARIGTALVQDVAACATGRLSVLSWGEQDGTLYVVEPAPTAPSLKESVEHSGPMSAPGIVPLLQGVASAMAALEAAQMSHPWLTPENVHPGAAPQVAGQAWPSVFAILREEDPTFDWPEPEYAAPEVQAGAPSNGHSESYSAAALMVYALTGQAPGPQTRLDAATPAMVHAIQRALSPDPATRYASVKAMVVDLTVEQAIGLTDAADLEAVPDGGDVPDWGAELLRETSARRDAGRPLVDTVPEAAPAASKQAAPKQKAPAAPSPAAPEAVSAPAPSAKVERKAKEPKNDAPAFDWEAGAPRKSLMPMIVSIIAALFILAGLALTFLRK
jgi:hypothetical protein